MGDLIYAFMHIANNRLWLRVGRIGKDLDLSFLKLKATRECHEVLYGGGKSQY